MPRNISNSEVTAFLSCKRMYNFAFMDELEPKEPAIHLERGSVGHEAFDRYIKARIHGENHESAMNYGMEAFRPVNGGPSIDAIMQAQSLWHRYMKFHNGWPNWEILGAEERLELPLTDSLNLVMRYDFYIRDLTTGKYKIGDWKFTYDFWSDIDHALNPQMPKYVACLQANGIPCDEGVLIEIRTRKLGKEKSADPANLWKETTYRPSTSKKSQLLKQHIATSLAIERHRELNPEEREAESLPVLNKYGACKFCNFTSLCESMIEGKRDLSVDIREHYQPSSYGYNKPEQDF